MDTLTVVERSERMARIRSKDTEPELLVRSAAHRLGYRFRLHRKDLPGAPDLVFPARKKVVFVHGCFWHAHAGCKVANRPRLAGRFGMRSSNETKRVMLVTKSSCGVRDGMCLSCGNARLTKLIAFNTD